MGDRRRRTVVIEALDLRTRQFRSRDGSWPFRLPHEPLDLDEVIDAALAGEGVTLSAETLRSRPVLRMEWNAGGLWDLWSAVLPSGIILYCDTDGHETRVLASAKRGTPADADGFFLERLAESHGAIFGIEMAGAPPDRVKASTIGDRAFLADVFVELFEGTDAEGVLSAECSVLSAECSVLSAECSVQSAECSVQSAEAAADFHAVVVQWLSRVLSAPPMTRRQPRVRDEDPSAL